MEQVKICMACGKNLSKHSCNNCGAVICDMCYSRKRGICVNCISGKVAK